MAKLAVKKSTTDVTVYLFIQDSSSTAGAGKTGLAYNTADLVCYYVRPGGTAQALSLATQTVDGAHTDGGFVEVSSANMPGLYRLDLPDAVCATGVNTVVVMLKGASGMAPVALEIQLVSYEPNDSVRLGITALPNAEADGAGGLPISDAGGLDLDTQIGTDIDAIKSKTDNLPADPADDSDIDSQLATINGLVDDLESRLTATRAGYLDKLNVSGTLAHSDAAATYKADVSALALEATLTAIKGAGWTSETLKAIADAITALNDPTPQQVWEYATRTLTDPNSYKADISDLALEVTAQAVKAKTDNLPASPAPANEYDARMTAIQADLDNPAQYKADVSGLATSANLSIVDNIVDAIKLKTDLIPADPAQAGDEMDLSSDALNALLATEVFTGWDLKRTLTFIADMMGGKLSRVGSTITIRNILDTLDRLVAGVDEDGQRLTVTINDD